MGEQEYFGHSVLTEPERAAGRVFRGAAAVALSLREQEAPGTACPWTLTGYRHECSGAGKGRLASAMGRTVLLPLREHYWTSPQLVACPCGAAEPVLLAGAHQETGKCGPVQDIPAGLLCFIFKEGRCPDCGLQVRSASHLAIAALRPPAPHALEEEFNV